MHTIAAAPVGDAACAAPALERRFWEITGAPEIPDLDWLFPEGSRTK